MIRAVAPGVLAVAVVAALLAGPGPFGVVVTGVAVLLVLDLSGVLARTGSRPVVVAAFVPGAGLPAAIAYWPGVGWDDIPAFFAAALATASVLVLVFGRRHGVTAGIGATLVVSLVVGLGSAGLLLLHELGDGFRWALGFLLLAAAADAGGVLGHRLVEGRTRPPALEGMGRPLGSFVAVVVGGTAVAVTLAPPFTPVAAALVAGVALVAALGVKDLGRALATEAGIDGRPRRLLGQGLLVGSAGTVLLGAPAAYVLARGVGL